VAGRVVRAHGIRGEVVVEPLSEDPSRFAPGSSLLIGDPDGAPAEMRVRASRPHQGRLLVLFDGIEDRNGAEALRGSLISIDAGAAPPPPAGRYYAHEIEGLRVVDEAGNDLGTVSGILETRANDVWIVSYRGREVLVPAVHEIVVDVDVLGGRIVVRPVPGLFE